MHPFTLHLQGFSPGTKKERETRHDSMQHGTGKLEKNGEEKCWACWGGTESDRGRDWTVCTGKEEEEGKIGQRAEGGRGREKEKQEGKQDGSGGQRRLSGGHLLGLWESIKRQSQKRQGRDHPKSSNKALHFFHHPGQSTPQNAAARLPLEQNQSLFLGLLFIPFQIGQPFLESSGSQTQREVAMILNNPNVL